MSKLLDAEIDFRPDAIEAVDFFIDKILFLLEHPEAQVESIPDGPSEPVRKFFERIGEEW
jgi:hypothetical protein